MQSVASRIDDLVEMGWKASDGYDYRSWENRVFAFLSAATDEKVARKFKDLGVEGLLEGWAQCRDRQLGHLEGLALKLGAQVDAVRSKPALDSSEPSPQQTKKVFVVHGHDNEVKETVARFIEKLGLIPVVLHEKPNAGKTIIEKFEVFSDVGFAVVLLTPDDIGAAASDPKTLKPRARQNVILELGYFMGKLTRFRVCALYKPGVEIPSDYQGVLYVEYDGGGAWKQKLAQELVEANFSIDLDGLLRG